MRKFHEIYQISLTQLVIRTMWVENFPELWNEIYLMKRTNEITNVVLANVSSFLSCIQNSSRKEKGYKIAKKKASFIYCVS